MLFRIAVEAPPTAGGAFPIGTSHLAADVGPRLNRKKDKGGAWEALSAVGGRA